MKLIKLDKGWYRTEDGRFDIFYKAGATRDEKLRPWFAVRRSDSTRVAYGRTRKEVVDKLENLELIKE